jgi:hypothetical protein
VLYNADMRMKQKKLTVSNILFDQFIVLYIRFEKYKQFVIPNMFIYLSFLLVIIEL